MSHKLPIREARRALAKAEAAQTAALHAVVEAEALVAEANDRAREVKLVRYLRSGATNSPSLDQQFPRDPGERAFVGEVRNDRLAELPPLPASLTALRVRRDDAREKASEAGRQTIAAKHRVQRLCLEAAYPIPALTASPVLAEAYGDALRGGTPFRTSIYWPRQMPKQGWRAHWAIEDAGEWPEYIAFDAVSEAYTPLHPIELVQLAERVRYVRQLAARTDTAEQALAARPLRERLVERVIDRLKPASTSVWEIHVKVLSGPIALRSVGLGAQVQNTSERRTTYHRRQPRTVTTARTRIEIPLGWSAAQILGNRLERAVKIAAVHDRTDAPRGTLWAGHKLVQTRGYALKFAPCWIWRDALTKATHECTEAQGKRFVKGPHYTP